MADSLAKLVGEENLYSALSSSTGRQIDFPSITAPCHLFRTALTHQPFPEGQPNVPHPQALRLSKEMRKVRNQTLSAC